MARGTAVEEDSNRFLLVRAGGRTCALPVSFIIETMRIVPMQPVAGAPDALLGLSIIRGEATPVVDLAALLGGSRETQENRLVTIRAGERTVALAVQGVLGICDPGRWAAVPPLLQDACAGRVKAIGALDSEFLWVLEAGRLVTREIWDSLTGEV